MGTIFVAIIATIQSASVVRIVLASLCFGIITNIARQGTFLAVGTKGVGWVRLFVWGGWGVLGLR